jgi:hypothetical protein
MVSCTSDDVVESLSAVVQKNCHIADAQFAGDYTLCVYLLKMREYYRWEKRLPFNTTLPSSAVGDWLTEREELWDELAEQPYEPIPVRGRNLDPFETAQINEILVPEGLVYSGGLGKNARPHFFLARLQRSEEHNGYSVLVSSDELARDLTAPPAMTLDRTIFIRRESLRRMLWEKVEEWLWRKQQGAMSRALDYYNFQKEPDAALEAMTDNELEAVILHEIGEIEAGEQLGEEWHEMLAALPHSQAELMARAVRDHLADCLSTVPSLLDESNEPSVHFYFGNFRAMRRELFPALEQAYNDWVDNGRVQALREAARRGAEHWNSIAQQMLELFRAHGTEGIPHIEALVRENKL